MRGKMTEMKIEERKRREECFSFVWLGVEGGEGREMEGFSLPLGPLFIF